MNNTINYLKTILKKDDVVAIGLSGGPDSMCLLDILLSLNLNLKIIAIHINHNIRKESDDEAVFVKEYCNQHNVVYEYTKFDKKSQTDNYNEQELREKRYIFFDEITKKYNAKYLFTAHHGDDLIETIQMRLTRGSNLKGYCGFLIETPKKQYSIVRPLVYVTKQIIEDYNKEHNVPFVIDQTNFNDKYTRNRYRQNILPFLKKENPDVHLKYLSFSNELKKYYDFVNTIVSKELAKRFNNSVLDIENFSELEPLIQEKLLEQILDSLYPDNLNIIGKKHLNSIISIISSKKPNTTIDLPGNIIIKKEYNNLIFQTTQDKPLAEYKLILEDEIKLNNNYIIQRIDDCDNNSNYVIRLNSNELDLPLYIRSRKPGDKMYIKNMNGSKKIKDIYIDSKLTKEERNNQPILVDNKDNILWLPGLKKSKFDKAKNENYDIILRYEQIYEQKGEIK